MDHRRALRACTNASLGFFAVMTLGVVLWTTDEVLGWDLFPDWLGMYAQLIVMVLAILAVSAVVASVICSMAVMADSAARRAGFPEIVPSRRNRILALAALPVFVLVLFSLHQVDVWRQARLHREQQARIHDRYQKTQRDLRAHIAPTVGLFSAETASALTGPALTTSDMEVARLLRAIQASTVHGPAATVMVRAPAPYRYCVIGLGDYDSNGARQWLRREYFTDLPSQWERDAVAKLFGGQDTTVPDDRPGVFLDTRDPSAWAPLRHDSDVVGIVMLRAGVDRS